MVSGARSARRQVSYQALLQSPLPGDPLLAIRTEQGALSGIELLQQAIPVTTPQEPATVQALALLEAYFNDPSFPLPPLRPLHGTPFQHRVWQLLQQIPPGETRTYGELAALLQSSARAVAGACRANPIAILIPCHRVVSADGLGGYMGQRNGPALAIKRWLLHHEAHV